VLLDVPGDEGTERDDGQPLPARVLQRGFGQAAAEPAALVGSGDIGVCERDPVLPLPVGKLSDPLAAEKQLVPVRLGDVDDDHIAGRCRPRLA
jgi:hypothetical protein